MRIVFDKYAENNTRIGTTTRIEEILKFLEKPLPFSYVNATDGISGRMRKLHTMDDLLHYMQEVKAWKYLYAVYDKNNPRILTTSFIVAENEANFESGEIILITDFVSNTINSVTTKETLDLYREGLERAASWKPEEDNQKQKSRVEFISATIDEIKKEREKIIEGAKQFSGSANSLSAVSDCINSLLGPNSDCMTNLLNASIGKSGENTKSVAEPVKKDMINPSHYKNYCQELQWVETMQYLPRFRNPESFKAALEFTLRGYIDRCGQKDSELQELQKCLWYLKFLTAYVKNNNMPIRIADVDSILAAP